MRRPPGLWILLSAGVVWLSLQDVYGIRATSLIFGKSTTTSTTPAPEQASEASEEEVVTTELSSDVNDTKPTLTGNPQIDYIWDPNLPKELNGYNLSDYPFYERVPEDIDFKCDGLHDGFYASVVHKCQVYHHCLYGTRYDFLCANYTAFDQRTFICHFASEIDCVNSKKFWHRNDALYKAATTTTIKPFVIYTTPPPVSPVTVSPQSISPSVINPSGPGPRRPNGGRRRPFRRRRPQFDYYDDDYYDDYYEERPRSNRGRKRPRPRAPRPRPIYDDDYDEEYKDDRYERRGGSRRDETRRPYDRRPSGKRRNQDRIKHDYDEDADRYEDDDFKSRGRGKPNDRKTYDDDPDDERYPENKRQNKRRPQFDRDEDERPPRKGQRRPVNDDYDDNTFQGDDSRSYERPRKNEERRSEPKDEPKTIIKPVSGTIYDRPRVAPRIKLPVPKNEANKYAYKPTGSTQAASVAEDDEEYYDDYEDSLPRRKNIRPTLGKAKEESRRDTSTETRQRPRRPEVSYDSPGRSRLRENKRPRYKPSVSAEYYDDYEEYEDEEQRPVKRDEKRGKASSTTSTTTSTTTTTTTTEKPIDKVYHHCLFGTRYDFLCANYTAFDQTLFNCNFVSNVDCENSKKFWHRNDELYIEKSTTTVAPVVYNFHTPPPQGTQLTPAPVASAQLPYLPPVEPAPPRRSPAARARPYARPSRPQYDYYEEEYEELPRPKGRKRRPRPRPVYYDDYEEYEDDRLPRRNAGRRRPYWRERLMRRGKDRRKYDYDDDDDRYEYDDVVLDKSHKDKRRKLLDDLDYEDDRRDRYERRRSPNRRNDKPSAKADKRLLEDDDEDYEETRYSRRKPKDESRDFDRRRPFLEESDGSKKVPRLGKRRPPSEDFEDDLQRADNSRFSERPKKGNRDGGYVKPPDEGRPIIKPVSGTIYDRPRVAPRISLPVPKNAAEKYAYKPIGAKATPASKIEDDDDDEEIDQPSTKRSKYDRRHYSPSSDSTPLTSSKFKDADFSESPFKAIVKSKPESKRPSSTTTPASKNIKSISDDYEYYDEDLEEEISSKKDEVKLAPTSTTTTESVVDHPMPIIRKFKRPFLPSRGGNPFSARNLQPVGSKVSSRNDTQGSATTEASSASSSSDLTRIDNGEIQEVKPDFRPIPVRVMSPILKSTTATPAEVTSSSNDKDVKSVELESEIKPGPIRIKVPIRVVPPITEEDTVQSQKGYKHIEPVPTEPEKTKLDILNGNYDVTLNEAISPIVPKLPGRSFGGFAPTNDYVYKRIQRPTKYVILDPVVSDVSPYYVK